MLKTFLAVLTLAGASLYAHSPAQVIVTPVNGTANRAACEDSSTAGGWVFTITAISGSISRLTIQTWINAGPSTVDGEPTVCASYTGTGFDALGRPQAICPNMNVGTVQSSGRVTKNQPQAGDLLALTLGAGARCIRTLATGNGSITISVTHP